MTRSDASPIHARPVNVRMKFKSGPMAVRAALAHVLSELEPLNIGQGELGTIEIVLAEAMNNVVEHAYPENEPQGPIALSCQTDDDSLHVRIVDDGKPLPGEQLPVAQQANLDTDLQDLPEGGFGWFLILELAKDVSYRRDGNSNVLDMRLPLVDAASTPAAE